MIYLIKELTNSVHYFQVFDIISDIARFSGDLRQY